MKCAHQLSSSICVCKSQINIFNLNTIDINLHNLDKNISNYKIGTQYTVPIIDFEVMLLAIMEMLNIDNLFIISLKTYKTKI